MTAFHDWLGFGVVDNDREAGRSAALSAERDCELHPAACRCRECVADEVGPEEWR
jgi:hypothetical protein